MAKFIYENGRQIKGFLALFVTLFLIWWLATEDFIFFNTLDVYSARLLFLVVMVSFFPIALIAYQVFQKETRYERFRLDIGLLGISTDEATQKFQRQYGLANYMLQVVPTVLFTILGSLILLNIPIQIEDIANSGAQPQFFVKDVLSMVSDEAFTAMQYGFLGAYLFSIQLVYRRFTTLDMQPSVFMFCTMTIVAGLVLNLVAFQAISEIVNTANPIGGIGAGALAIIAFSIGYFPNMAIRWFNRVSNTALGLDKRQSIQYPLSMIDGISQWHETRLMDNGIDNIQNLASADIVELLLNTAFTVQEVIDWVDQSILYLYLDPHDIENFRRVIAVRTTTDFRDIWSSVRSSKDKEEIAGKLQTTVEKLDALNISIQLGANSHYIIPYWENARKMADAIRTKDFEKSVIKLASKDNDIGEIQRALDIARRAYYAIKERIDASEFVSEEALVGLGEFHRKNGDFDEAISAYKEAIERFPKSALARNNLAWLYINNLKDSGKYGEALELAKSAVEISREPAYLDTLAACYIKFDDLDKAEELLNEAKQAANLPDRGLKKIEEHMTEIEALRRVMKDGAASADEEMLQP